MLTALKASSLSRSRWASGCAFLEVCLHPGKPRFSRLRHTLMNSVNLPSATISCSSLHEHLLYGRSLPGKAAFKTHSYKSRARRASRFLLTTLSEAPRFEPRPAAPRLSAGPLPIEI
jgi:hypothetical protein